MIRPVVVNRKTDLDEIIDTSMETYFNVDRLPLGTEKVAVISLQKKGLLLAITINGKVATFDFTEYSIRQMLHALGLHPSTLNLPSEILVNLTNELIALKRLEGFQAITSNSSMVALVPSKLRIPDVDQYIENFRGTEVLFGFVSSKSFRVVFWPQGEGIDVNQYVPTLSIYGHPFRSHSVYMELMFAKIQCLNGLLMPLGWSVRLRSRMAERPREYVQRCIETFAETELPVIADRDLSPEEVTYAMRSIERDAREAVFADVETTSRLSMADVLTAHASRRGGDVFEKISRRAGVLVWGRRRDSGRAIGGSQGSGVQSSTSVEGTVDGS